MYIIGLLFIALSLVVFTFGEREGYIIGYIFLLLGLLIVLIKLLQHNSLQGGWRMLDIDLSSSSSGGDDSSDE